MRSGGKSTVREGGWLPHPHPVATLVIGDDFSVPIKWTFFFFFSFFELGEARGFCLSYSAVVDK